MSVDSHHPLYASRLPDWHLLRDSYEGERVVKQKGTVYLPATPGQVLDGATTRVGVLVSTPDNPTAGVVVQQGGIHSNKGQQDYDSYRLRAHFHEFVSDAVLSYVGLLHAKPATFELPDGMKDLLNSFTIKGESCEQLLRKINEQQLITGRLGLLLDINAADPAKPLPYAVMYNAEACINWDDSDDKNGVNTLNLVIMDESTWERQPDYNWELCTRYRICELYSDFKPNPDLSDEDNEIAAAAAPRYYRTATVDQSKDDVFDVINAKWVAPSIRGKQLDKVPFIFCNTKDVVASPDKPPLLGLAQLCMTIYRGEADYRQSLFMQGQDTLVIIGGLDNAEDPTEPDGGARRVGAGARLDVSLGGDAKYIGVESTGLTEQREALDNDKKEAESKSGKLIAPGAGKQESGDALTTRLAAQTATLTSIAKSGAAALEFMLKTAAEWMGFDPEKVKVTPNLEFVEQVVDGQSVVQLMTARTMGAPLSKESIHSYLVEKGLTQLSFEDEMEKIKEEDAEDAAHNESLGLDPTGAVIPPPEPNDPNAPPQKGGKTPPAA